ncbi:MAG TPA: hypothetical protein DGT58_06000, partial [Erysipelotrichaceae bacterium]|nr:hypothetical protein [Erysipelotrichaceae bacterium]
MVSGKATITNTYQEIHNFDYSGKSVEFTVPADGYYQLEVWGASGGDFNNGRLDKAVYGSVAGYGGYSEGITYLKGGTKLYVIVGEQGKAGVKEYSNGPSKAEPSFNGGGASYATFRDQWIVTSGGGMTHISTTDNPAEANLQNDITWNPAGTIIVAGGGGGADNAGNMKGQGDDGSGGDGGGETGGEGRKAGKDAKGSGGGEDKENTEFTYNRQGAGESYNNQQKYDRYRGYRPSYGDVAGGGGGWYGGAVVLDNDAGAGGGSGYINRDEYQWTDEATLGGWQQIPVTDGSEKTEKGHLGNGYARISFVNSASAYPSQSESVNSGDSTDQTSTTDDGTTTDNGKTITYQTSDSKRWTQIDDNKWKYVLNVFDDTATYAYWEESIDGYTSDAPSAEDKNVVINGSEQKTLVVTNTATSKYGSITVSKKVVDSSDNELTDSTQDFTFTLTLKNGDSPLTGTQVIGDQVFTNGSVTFTLHEGESKRFDNVPIGMNYEVSETPNENYTTTYNNGEALPVKGSVTVDDPNVRVDISNTYTPESKSRTEVTLEKKAEGSVAGSEKDEYPFHAHLTGLDANLEFSVVIGSDDTDTTVQNYMSNAQGEADVTLNLKADQKAVFKDVPVGATYRFVEDAGQWTARFKAANATADGTIARTSGENTSENQELATETETVEEGEKTTVTFINTLAFTQQLTVKKTVEHGEGEKPADHPNEKFEVTVTFTGLKPGARIDTDSVGILTADDTGIAVKTFNMKDQQSVVFRNVPVSATYQVKETGNDYIGSLRIYYGKDQTPIGSGQNDAANKDLNTTEKTMVKDQDPTVELISGTRWVKVAFRKEAEDGTKLHGANFTLYKGTGD